MKITTASVQKCAKNSNYNLTNFQNLKIKQKIGI